MSEPQKKPGVKFWMTVALVVMLLAYPLSFGPVCRVVGLTGSPVGPLVTFYGPLYRAAQYPGWEWPIKVVTWYGGETGELVEGIAWLNDWIHY